MERRQFHGYIMQQSDIHGRRLSAYLAGTDLLLEAERIEEAIFNFEQDLWSY